MRTIKFLAIATFGVFEGLGASPTRVGDTKDDGKSQAHMLSKRELHSVWCSSEMHEKITIGLHQAQDIFQRTGERLYNLTLYLGQPDVPDINEQSAELASTFRTYRTFYSHTIPTGAHDKEINDRYEQVDKIQSLMKMCHIAQRRLFDLLDRPIYARPEIYCGLHWLVGSDEREHWWYDNRTSAERSTGNHWYHPPLGSVGVIDHAGYPVLTFASDDTPVGIVMNDLAGPFPSVISLNAPVIARLSHDLAEKRQSNFPFESMHISRIVDGELAPLLLKLLVRTNAIVPRPDQLGRDDDYQPKHKVVTIDGFPIKPDWHNDNMCEFIIGGSTCAVWLAGLDPNAAYMSLNNFMWFASAMYLDLYDWSSGSNMNMSLAARHGGFRWVRPPPRPSPVYEPMPRGDPRGSGGGASWQS